MFIPAMQQHLQRQAAAGKSGNQIASLAAAMAAASANKGGNLANMGLNQRALLVAQQQLAQQALKWSASGGINPATAKQILSMMSGGTVSSTSTTTPTTTTTSSQIICEICDTQVQDKERYLHHLQVCIFKMCVYYC